MYDGKEAVFVVQVYANPLSGASQPAESDKSEINQTQKVASVNKKEPTNILGAGETTNISAGAISSAQNPTFLEKTLASPRHTTDIILYIIFGIIALVLLLYIFIKRKNLRKDLIINGLVIFILLVAIFITNYYLTHRNMAVTQSMDYSSQDK